MRSLPVHRSILAVDVERSTGPLRTNPIKGEMRRQVYRLLHEAMAYAGVETGHCDPFEDRGDGVLALIRPEDNLPKTYLISRLVPELARLLGDYNLGLPPAEWPRRGLRLRVVVHAGEVHHDPNGYFGEDLDVACRLLDAPRFKRVLRCSSAPLALVVSEEIYLGIIRHEYDGLRAGDYRPEVRVTVFGRRRVGYVHVPAAEVHTGDGVTGAAVTVLHDMATGTPAA